MGIQKINILLHCLIALNTFGWTISSRLKSPVSCGLAVCEPGFTFNYTSDVQYVYEYNAEIASLFRGTSDNSSTLYIKAELRVNFFSPCQGKIWVRDVVLSEKPIIAYDSSENVYHPNSEVFAESISKYPLRFSFNDGNIEEICPHESDPVWVLNFKRGILSSFHTTLKRFDVDHDSVETDVNGHCQTRYRLQKAKGTSLLIHKVKNLNFCDSRNEYHTVVQANRYRFGSDFQAIPLVKSRQKCELTIDHKIYSEIQCEEIHTFRPFSKNENGSQTIIHQSYKLISEISHNLTEPEVIKKRTNLLFDHTATPKPTSGELKTSRDLIKLMCQLNADDVQDGYAEAFATFIQTARRLSHSALSLIYNRAGSICSTGRKHVADAFSYIGSNVAVAIMKDAILQNSVSESRAREWLLSMAFIPKPDEETISLIVPLIHHPKVRNESQYLFSVSSLINTYCKQNTFCEKNENIKKFLEFMENKVHEGCSRGPLDRNLQTEVLIILKSLGNVDLTTPNLRNYLRQCLEDEKLNMAVRVAAIQSNRRLSCKHSRRYYLDIYKNSSFDAEIRIASYLEVMRCPSYFVTTTVRRTLEEEDVNQVGSFVWSHLNNLLKSSALNKVEIQSLLTDKNLNEKFKLDSRKFSRNYEYSIFLDEYNLGGNIESNIIFSSKSYLPRSGMINITVDIFGRSVNILEIDTRLEGFEHVLEYAFGPGGPFSATEVGRKLEKLSRVIREAPDHDSSNLGKKFPNVIDNNFKVPKFSVGVKVFGNEISFTDVVGHPEFNDLLDKINPELRIRQILSGKEINFNKAVMFLDADYIVPTGTGFPLNLAATGTAALSLNFAGNIKSLHLLALDVQGKLQPSFAVDVTGQMGVDVYYASTGIKLKTSLHSSVAVNGHIKVEGTTFAKVSFNLPKEKADIITAQTQLIVMKNDQEEIQSGILENRIDEHICSWPTLDHTLGLKLCSNIVFPNATKYLDDRGVSFNLLRKNIIDKHSWFNFILNGPAKFALVLYKADPTAKEYVLQYNWVHEGDTAKISLVYDTPNSQLNRELSARLLLNKSSRNLTLLLRAVDNKFEAYGKYKYTPTEKYLDFFLDVNGRKQFVAQIGLRTKEVKYGNIYQPKLYVAINEERIAELSGTVKIIEKNEINQCDVNLEFKTKKLSTKLFGYISKGSSSFSADLKLSYHFSTPEYVRIALKWVNKSSKSLVQLNGEFSLDASAYKHFNFESALKYQRAHGHAECTIEINTQPHLKDDDHKFTIKFVFSLSKNFNRTKLHTYIEMTKAIGHIDLKFEFKIDINHHGHDDKSTTILLLRYATGKEIVATLGLSLPRSEMFKMDAKLNITLPSFVPMILTTKIEEKKFREYDITVTWFNGHSLTGKGIYMDKSEGVVTSHSVKLFLQSPSFNDVAIVGKILMDDVQFKLDLQADHNNEKYSILLKHASQSPMELDLYGEVRYKASVYSLTTIVNLMKQRQVLVELHLDQYRDIHVILNGVNSATHKEAGIEIKWDANRDPSQRFEAAIWFLHPRSLNYSLDFSLSYPGRLIKGNTLFAIYGLRFDFAASMEWSPHEMVDVKVEAVYQNQKGKTLKVTSQLLTPFAGWKRTSLNTGIHKENNQLRLNGTVWWQDNQTVSLDIFGDYALLKKKLQEDEDYSDFDLILRPDIPDLWVEFRASLISTVAEVKPVSASFKHKQNNNCFNTIVHLKGQTNQLISINSTWELSPNPNSTNITGTVFFVSPYKGYEKGTLIGRLYYTLDLDIHGVTELDVDRKKYSATIDGYIKTIKDNKLIIDVNTPIEIYSKITGKLGYSEKQRHLMCIWESPLSSIGFEIIFDFRHAANFDLKFLTTTPFEFFSRLLLRGKLKPEMANFKVGLNHLLLGFEGYWKYENFYNLDYKYILYTPLEGFKENGVVARIIYNKNIDTELSLKVAEVKLGALVLCGRKPKSAIDLKSGNNEEEDKLSWNGHLQIDTYFYPTITGSLDIEEEEDVYFVEGNLKLPNGTIDLMDNLNFEDIFNIKNKLFVNTSFAACKEIKSDFVWDIMLGEYHIIGLDVDILHYFESKKGRLLVNYTIETIGSEKDEEEYEISFSGHKIHKSYIRLDTPWKEFLMVDFKGCLETEDNTYKANITLYTDQSHFSGTGNLELEDGFLGAGIGMVMTSPSYNIPEFKLSAKREITSADKNFEVLLLIKSPAVKTYHIEWLWHFEPPNSLRLRGKIDTPIEYLRKAEVMLLYSHNPEEKRMAIDSRLSYHPNVEFKFNSLKRDKSLTFDAEIPLKGFEELHFAGSVANDGTNGNIINGVLMSNRISYNVEGTYTSSERNPLILSIFLRPQTEGFLSTTISINTVHDALGYEFQGVLQRGHDRLNVRGKFHNDSKNSSGLSLLIGGTYPQLKHIDMEAKIVQTENGMINLDLKGRTQWKWIETLAVTASYLRLEKTGSLRGTVTLPKITSFIECDCTWYFMERMELIYNAGYTAIDMNESRHIKGGIFYRNPGKNFKYLSTGVDSDVDGFFIFGVNGTLLLPTLEDIKMSLNLRLPPPEPEIHSLVGKLRYAQGFSYIAQTLKYSNQMGGVVYGTSGEFSYNNSDIQGNLKVEWGKQEEAKAVTNVFLMKRSEKHLDVQYNLLTPHYKEDTVLAKLISTKENGHFHVKAHLLSPKSTRLSFADVRFSDIYNMNGTLNTTTPFPQLSYAGTTFEILTQKAKRSKRYVQMFWSNNTALLDSEYIDTLRTETRKGFVRKIEGKLLVEIPLATRHLGEVIYGYEEIPLKASGHCSVDYNKKRLLDGTYKCDSESRAGFSKDIIDISAENTYLPLGVHYVHQFEYSGGNNGTNYPTTDKKTADIFQLNNRTNFNLKGILEVKTSHTGKDIKLTAIHANRTVDLDTNYHFLDHEFKHYGWLRLDPQVWGSYDLHIINKTVEGKDEEHIVVNLAYPKRNFTITGFLKSDQQHHESELKLDWDRPHEAKTIGAGVEWWRVSRKPDQQVLTISFKHPSFPKDVTFNGTYIRHGTKSLFAKLDVDYSPQLSKKVIIEGKIQDLSNTSVNTYQMDILAKHPATKLDLLATGTAHCGLGVLSLDSDARYERSFLTLQHGNITAKINTNDKEVSYCKRFQRDETYLKINFMNDEVCCSRLNGSIAKSNAFNYSGDFFVDVDEKIIEFLVNMTPDALETFHASGRIPDVRNAYLNIWRDFEDVTVSDVAFYLKLNHSRLVTSKLKWRPKLHKEVISGVEHVFTSLLKHVEDTLEYWKIYTRSEIKEAIYDIWLNSKPDIQEFLKDLEALKSLGQDFEEFKKFLNDSYNNNNFYVKDITGKIVVLVDELAINGHVQALPDILNEMWQVMGESGEAIRNSIIWIIDTVKTSYKKAIDFLRGFFKGDSAEQISALIANIIDKYDKMVKDLQVTVVRHLEQLWNNFTALVSEYWEFFLKSVEPTFIKFAHYAETAFLQASNEILDFLYERKVELIKSPYFSKLANFTADFDKFYKDITKNSTISNIKKYSVKFYEFLKEKYFTIVPFGKEIQEIIDEIINEIKELNKLPSINYLVEKTNDLYNKLVWIWESLDLETKTQSAISLVLTKMTDGTQSALDADIRYRKAKTKFVFDIDEGIVLLEQKLPMSWHAFNETPRFEEIPEYRVIAKFQNYLAFSNKTFWTLYHEYKPYTEMQNWFPPFKAQAIIAGSQFFMTFDKTFYEFRAPCDYLLAHDFVNNKFSLLMTKDSLENPDHFVLVLISNQITISIDMFTDTVKLPKTGINYLPAEFGNLFIYKEMGVITIEDKDGYILQCNVLFKVCSLTISGWYFGKTAGLLGTMDHEKTTDFLTPNGYIEKEIGKFANSWALNKETCIDTRNQSHSANTLNEELFNTCASLFKSKHSQFSTCFSWVNAAPFMTLCLNSRKSFENSDVCTAAVAYSVACQAEHTPLPVPDFCIQCKLSNGETVPEGKYYEVSGKDIPKSTDVVFIIEAKDCNRKPDTEKNMEILHTSLSKELIEEGLTNNRFAIVVFGGDGVYDRPRTLLLNQNVFNPLEQMTSYSLNFPIGSGNEDIFEAIAFASHLNFRPAVSKTFIVLPCSNCDSSNMTIDYSSLREVLLDGNIKLHILMNNEFIFEKQRIAKTFYGIDGKKAFTKKDFKMMRGDSELRKQAKLPKSMMGYCAPLALETNGTVFTALRMESGKKNAAKKFASVFSKRVAKYAEPSSCQKCECSRYESGMSYMDCHPCHYPLPANIDLCLNDYGCDLSDLSDLYDEGGLRHPDNPHMDLDGESSEV